MGTRYLHFSCCMFIAHCSVFTSHRYRLPQYMRIYPVPTMLESPKNPQQHSYSNDIWQGQQQNAGDREIVITCDQILSFARKEEDGQQQNVAIYL